MSELALTVDLGNSRWKARVWEIDRHGAPTERAAWGEPCSEHALDRLDAWLAGIGRIDRGVLSAVADRATEAAVRARLRARCADVVESADAGLDVAVREPARVGADRLFAARGAYEHVRAAAIVVDAGTALTVDALRVPPDSPRAVFAGGAIAPGPALMAVALARGGARLAEIEPRPGARALGRDTGEAMQAGIVVGFEGAALRLVERVASESGVVGPIVLTGGAAEYLRPVLERALVVPDLVHHGMLATLGARTPPEPRGARA